MGLLQSYKSSVDPLTLRRQTDTSAAPRFGTLGGKVDMVSFRIQQLKWTAASSLEDNINIYIVCCERETKGRNATRQQQKGDAIKRARH